MTTKFVPVKTGFRGRTMKVAVDSIPHEPLNVKSRRSCIGGRGREWGPECFKLLEEMTKMDDCQIFMQPIDAVKHPEYYSMVKEPIDLSKIQLKFHNGQYQSMFTFVDDVHLVFSNHLLLYDNPSDPTHQSIQKVKLWFDNEVGKIKGKWFCFGQNSTSGKDGGRMSLLPRELGKRIDALEAENRSIVGSPLLADMPLPTAIPNLPSARPVKAASKGSTIHPRPSSKLGANPPVVLAKLPVSIATRRTQAKETRPLYAIQFSKSSTGQKIIIAPPPGTNPLGRGDGTPKNSPLLLATQRVAPVNEGADGCLSDQNSTDGRKESRRFGPASEILTNGGSTSSGGSFSEEEDVLSINLSNMWLGSTQVTPLSPIAISDEGISIHFRLSLAGKVRVSSQRSLSLEFHIQPDELVKCYTYINNPQKHSIFLVVLPNCIRRLKAAIEEKLDRLWEESCPSLLLDSCLVAMFTPAMSRLQVSRLMYFMWSIGKSNIFGSNLYTEINWMAALKLLSNVKQTPNGLPLATEPMARSVVVEEDGSRSHKGNDATDRMSPGMIGCSVVLEKLDMESVTESGSDGTKTDDQSDAAGTFLHETQPRQQQQHHHSSFETVELDEISMDSTQLKVEPLDDGFPTEVINDPKGRLIYVYNESAQDTNQSTHQDDGMKVRHVPGILSRRSSKRKISVDEIHSSSKKGKDEEATESSAPLSGCISSPQPDGILVHDTEIEEGGVVMEVEDVYADEIKDVEVVLPSDSVIDMSDLEIKVLDQSEEGELIWTGREINVKCPITQRIMKEPVKNALCGHTYDKIGVEELIKNRAHKARCPVPGCHNIRHLELSHLEPDETINQILNK